MNAKTTAALCAVLALSAFARAQDPNRGPGAPAGTNDKPAQGDRFNRELHGLPQGAKPTNFRLSFKLRAGELAADGNFVVADRAQGSYLDDGETPFDIAAGKGDMIETKKHAVIVNCVPSSLDGELVAVGCQFELSGPAKPETAMKVRPTASFQYQTDFVIRRGETIALVDGSERRVEIKLEELKP